jgi:hypothetical protein
MKAFLSSDETSLRKPWKHRQSVVIPYLSKIYSFEIYDLKIIKEERTCNLIFRRSELLSTTIRFSLYPERVGVS